MGLTHYSTTDTAENGRQKRAQGYQCHGDAQIMIKDMHDTINMDKHPFITLTIQARCLMPKEQIKPSLSVNS